MTTIGIRTEWNQHFGFGHLYRCVSLANKLESMGYTVIFFSRSAINPFIAEKQIVHISSSQGSNANIFKAKSVELVVNDMLDTDVIYMKSLASNYIKTLNLDDVGQGASWASRNIVCLRRINVIPRNTLLGLNYLVLREDFAKQRSRAALRKIGRKISRVVGISTGSRFSSMLMGILRIALHLKPTLKIQLFATESDSFEHYEGMQNLSITLNADINSIIKEMLCSDAGITGCGITAYEMACTGLPVITICKSDFEKSENRISEYGFAFQIDEDEIPTESKIVHALDKMSEQDTRRRMSEKGYNAVDGLGLYRVCKVIDELIHES